MGTFLFYIFETSLCLILLYFLFGIFFRTDTLFRINRLLLLVGTLSCTLLPFVQLDVSRELLWHQPISVVKNLLVEAETPVVDYHPNSNQLITVPSVRRQSNGTDIHQIESLATVVSWSTLIGALYITGVLVVFFFFLLSTWRLRQLIRRYPGCDYNGYRLIICPDKIVSFSWWNTIVLSQADYEKNAEEILLHEQMHLRSGHTFDLLWMELLIALHWFNPAVWLLRRELCEVHEYQADNGVLTYGIDATQYQLLLVKKSVGTRLYSMANGFNHSKLKKRINMMLKKRTSNWARLKLLLFVPVAAGTLYAFAQPEVMNKVEQLAKPVVVTQDSICVDEEELLEMYFKRKRIAALGDKENVQNDLFAQYDFFVNMRNQMLLDYESVKDADSLRVALTNLLREDYRKAISQKRTPRIMINVRYDRGAATGPVKDYLTVIKETYLQLRKEISAKSGKADEAYLDEIFPVLVNIMPPKIYGKRPNREEVLSIEVVLSQPDGSQSKTLKNFSLKELEKEVLAYKAGNKTNSIQVCLKVDSNLKMGVVNDVKGVIRKSLYK